MGSGSTHAARVDDTGGEDGDTTYIEDDVVGHTDQLTHQALTPVVGTIYGVDVVSVMRKVGAGAKQAALGIKSGASTSVVGGLVLTDTYKVWHQNFDLDPATGSLWTESALNAAEIQVIVSA